MASKRYTKAMAYIAKYCAKHASDAILFDYEYDDPDLGASVMADVSVGEYYQIETALEEKPKPLETIECPNCYGGGDCDECTDGTVLLPSTIIEYMALCARATHNHWRTGGNDGMDAHDVIWRWYDAVKMARRLYPDGD